MDAPGTVQGHLPLLPAVIVGLDTIYVQDGETRTVGTRSNLAVLSGTPCNGGPGFNGGIPSFRQVVPALLVSVRPKTPFFWKTGRLIFECNMRVSCFDVRKAKFFSCCEWEREFRQFVDEQIRMITKVMPVTKPAFVFS